MSSSAKEAGAALAAASDKHAFVGSEMGISDSVGGNMPSDSPAAV